MADKILIVEDELTLAMIISETLADMGFEVRVASDGVAGLEAFSGWRADLIIADVMMPRMDGFAMAARIRAVDPDVPLIFLSARSSVDDIVEGFELGANDYLRKPFKMRELVVRINALLRRRQPKAAAEDVRIAIGSYTFDTVTHELSDGRRRVELTHIEATLLEYLAAHAGATVTSSELMELVWKRDDYYNRNSLHGYIHKLRNHLRHDPAVTILNLRGIGYRLVIRPSAGT